MSTQFGSAPRAQTSTEATKFVRRKLGHELEDRALARVTAFVEDRMATLRIQTAAEYFRLTERDDREQAGLWRCVTVGETYFLREEVHLRNALQWAWERRAGSTLPLQIWCAGCSTGEESYSLAMLAAEEGIPVEILGTDVEARRLAAAKGAEYEEWSLRRVGASIRAAAFFELPRNRWRLAESLRRKVDFRVHNLMSGDYPRAPHSGWDLIFCRNVLFYFEPQARQTIFRRLLDCLAEHGRLLLSSAEPLQSARMERLDSIGGTILYAAGDVEERMNRPVPEHSSFESSVGSDTRETRPRVALPVPEEDSRRRAVARAAADLSAGRPDRAAVCLAAVTPEDSVCPEIQFLRGMIERSAARFETAEDLFRGALFLEPKFWPAAFLLATSLERDGRRREAATYYRRALWALESDSGTANEGRRDEWQSLRRIVPFRSDVLDLCRRRLVREHEA